MVAVKFPGARAWRPGVTDIVPVLLLIGVMTVVAAGVGATTLTLLYRTAFTEECARLLENVRTTVSFLEASTSAQRSLRHFEAPGRTETELVALFQDAHSRYERFEAGAEITLTKRVGDDIVFLLKHRHEGRAKPAKVPFASRLAEPARRALAGRSGTVIGLDFRGVEVLAAFAPVASLGLGVVTKVDLSDIRAPFLRAGGIAGAIALLLIVLGTLTFLRITNPMRRRLAESEARFRGISSAAQDAVIVMGPNGQVAFWNPAAERIFGYRSEEAVGRTVAKLLVPACYRAEHDAGVERFQRTGDGAMVGQTTEIEALTKDGREMPIELSLAALRFGTEWHAVAIIRDISARKAAEKQGQQRQELLSQIIEHIPHAVFWKDRHSVYLGCNRRFAIHAGLETPAAVLGKTDHELAWTKPQAEFYRSVDHAVMESGEPRLNLEEHQRRADGTEAMLLTSKVALRDAAGEVMGLLGVYADITERTEAEAALRSKTAELEAIHQAQPDLLFRFARDGTILDYTQGARAPETHLPPAQFLGKQVQTILAEPIGALFTDALAKIAAGATEVTIEYRLPRADGEHDCEARLVPLGEEQVLVMVRDVTEHRASVRGLAEREAQLRLILASTGEGIFGIDQDGRCVFANRACAAMLGYDDESSLLGQRMHRLTHHTRADGSPYPVEACPTYKTCRSAARTHVEGELLWRADGSAFAVDYQSHPMVQNGEVVGAVVTFSDMTERLEQREALRRERDFAESLIATAPVIILVLDPKGRIVRFNPFMAELTGYRLEEVQGQDWFTTFLPERERPRIQAVFQNVMSGKPKRGDANSIVTRSGEERLIVWYNKTLEDAKGELIGVLAIGHDITAERAREAQLFQAQKMEVIGRLTGGIAHDFNNLLTVILGNLELIEEQLPPDGLLRDFASDARSAAQNGAALTRRLLGFARKTPLQPVSLQVQEFLPQCERLLRRALNEATRLEVHCDATITPLYVDRAQLESALLNLALNAQDAMPDGGRLRIATSGLAVGPDGVTEFPTLRAGDYVVITVSDTGTGMSVAQLARATEPFYTTKSTGKGSGLGLSMVYSFARDSGGALRLQSQPGEGTEVSLALPVAPSQLEAEPQTVAQTDLMHGKGTILLVEDEARVRKLAKQYLCAAGYTVVEAETGDAALAVIRSGLIPDLLFSDIALPGTLDGYRLASRVEQDYPGVKVLLTTGADPEKLAGSGIDTKRYALLQKPYRAAVLTAAVHRLLAP